MGVERWWTPYFCTVLCYDGRRPDPPKILADTALLAKLQEIDTFQVTGRTSRMEWVGIPYNSQTPALL